MKNLFKQQKSHHKIYTDVKVTGIGPLDSPILFVGETPGSDECILKQPFVGSAGEVLNNCLARNGIPRESVRIENLFPYRPWDNDFRNVLPIPFFEIELEKLHDYIQTYRPIVIGALGNYPMHFLTGKGKRSKGGIIGIGNWRGSILPYVDQNGKVYEDIKVVPCYHPSAVNREKSLYPIFDTDIRRIKEESKSRGLNYPEYNIIANPTGFQLMEMEAVLMRSPVNAIDIETIKGTSHILSISFSPNPDEALVLSLDKPEHLSVISKLLAHDSMKVFHFGYFDTTQLKLNGFEIGRDKYSKQLDRPYFFDTYLGAHVLEPELPKTLAYETSVRTRQPYYKHEGKEDSDQKGWSKKFDRDRLYIYNGKDTCVDFKIFLQQADEISRLTNQDIFNFEMSSIELHTHISDSGMLIESERLELVKGALIARWAKLQYLMDGIAGFEVNTKSPLLKQWFYTKDKEGGLGLPTRYYKKKVTTNDAALVSLLAWCKGKMEDSVREDTKKKYRYKLNLIRSVREIQGIRQRLSMYVNARQSDDGRSRSTYKFGPETGRLAASKYVDGTGYNHQTNPRDPIEVSDEDFEKYSKEIKLLETLEPEIEEDEDE